MKAALRWVVPFALVMIAALFVFIGPRLDEIDEEGAIVRRLMEEYVNKKRQAVNLDQLRARLREVDEMLGVAIRALPNRFDRGWTDLIGAASSRGVRLEYLNPEGETNREFYAELTARIRATGRYHDLGRFASDIDRAPGSLLLQDLSLDPASTPGQVTMEARVRAFRYLDDEEVAAQRKAMAGRAAKK